MNFIIKLSILVAIAMILQFTAVFASKVGDKVNRNHIAAFYHNKSWEYTIIILSDGTQLDVKESVESIAKYF